MTDTVICSIARTPIGKFNGGLSSMSAVELGTVAMRAALERASLEPSQIQDVIFGHVIRGGTGQITSRQAAAAAGIPMTVPATNIDKVCLSGMAAIAEADRRIKLGEAQFVMAGGMESMSNAPFVLPKARQGLGVGDATLIDSMIRDGLFCSFDQCSMGERADAKNEELGIGRTAQDDWSVLSHQRALAATESGAFADEIAPVTVPQRKGTVVVVDTDEGIRPDSTAESLAGLRGAFTKDGTTTAGNASQISDGAAAVVVAHRDAAEAAGLPILAEVVGYGQIAGPDATLHERPAQAIQMALKRCELTVGDVELVEINEAFASVALWSSEMLGLSREMVNVHGGGVALGHPLGATGARIVVTLINALRRRGGGLGVAALCGGGGQGDAVVVRAVA